MHAASAGASSFKERAKAACVTDPESVWQCRSAPCQLHTAQPAAFSQAAWQVATVAAGSPAPRPAAARWENVSMAGRCRALQGVAGSIPAATGWGGRRRGNSGRGQGTEGAGRGAEAGRGGAGEGPQSAAKGWRSYGSALAPPHTEERLPPHRRVARRGLRP